MIKINLAPKEYIEKIERALVIAKIAFVSFLVFVFFLGISIWQFSRATALSIELSGKNLEYDSLKEDVKKADEIKAQINEINNYISAIDKITTGRYLYVAFMQDLANNLPETMWFSGINTAPSGDGVSVNANVISNSLYDVAWWISFLEKNARYQNVTVGNISVSETADGNVYSLPLSMAYAYKKI